MRKEDYVLKKKELKYYINEKLQRTFLLKGKQYQCGNCLTEFTKADKCPTCNTVADRIIHKNNRSYNKTRYYQVFRKQGLNIISLLFMIYDSKSFNDIERKAYLVRKIIYDKEMVTHVNNKFYYNSFGNIFKYYGEYEDRFYEEAVGVLKNKLPTKTTIYSKELLGLLPAFKYCDIPTSIVDIETTILFPDIIEMLQKKSKRIDLYNSIRTINKHKKTYIKYHNYFEKFGYISASILIKLSKFDEMLKYKQFEKIMNLGQPPKEIKLYEDLVAYSNLMNNVKYFDKQTYNDYLIMCVETGQDITLNSVRFNPNWEKEHNRIMNIAKIKTAKKKEKSFLKRYKGYKDYEDSGVHILVPKQVDDMFEESELLHHCVSSYVDRVSSGECLIFFIRKSKHDPFITVEVKDNKVVQMRGNYNNQDMILQKYKKIMRNFIQGGA